ncbi:hypothetical protein F4703DRAFT_1927380 [Phycomyces blakesleeanus]
MTISKNLAFSSGFPSPDPKSYTKSYPGKIKGSFKTNYSRQRNTGPNTSLVPSFNNGSITDNDQIQKKIATANVQEIDQIILAYERNIYRVIKQYCAQHKHAEDTKEAKSRRSEISDISAVMRLFYTHRRASFGPRQEIKPKAWYYNLRNNGSDTKVPSLRLLGYNPPNQDSIVFGTIDIYLSAFEAAMISREEDINLAWSNWLPVSLGKEHESWYNSTIKDRPLSWEQVKQLLRDKFNIAKQLRINGRVYNILPSNKDGTTGSPSRFSATQVKIGGSEDSKVTNKLMAPFSPSLYHKGRQERSKNYTATSNKKLSLRSGGSTLGNYKSQYPPQCNPGLRKYVDSGAGYSRHRLLGVLPDENMKLFCPMAREDIIYLVARSLLQ